MSNISWWVFGHPDQVMPFVYTRAANFPLPLVPMTNRFVARVTPTQNSRASSHSAGMPPAPTSATTGNPSPLLTRSVITLMLLCAGSNTLDEFRRSWCGSLHLCRNSAHMSLSQWRRQGIAISARAWPSRWAVASSSATWATA